MNPGAGEICNLMDDDCNGAIDEGVQLTFYRDVDSDLFGDDSMTTIDCSAPPGFTFAGGDCDDMNSGRNPGTPENCDTPIDDNCDEEVNEDCSCEGSETRPCEGVMGVCVAGQQTCSGGVFGACSLGPSPEVCGDGRDEDCDGFIDDEIEVAETDTLGPATTCEPIVTGGRITGVSDLCALTGVMPVPFVRLSLTTSNTSAGAYYAEPAVMGYGPLRFAPFLRVNVPINASASTRGGFAVVMLDDEPGSYVTTTFSVGSDGWNPGTPDTRSGLAVEWVFEVPFVGTADRIQIRRLDGSSRPTTILTCAVPEHLHVDVDPSGGLIDVPIEVEYTPANESRGTARSLAVRIAGEDDFDCQTTDERLPDWSFGDEIYVGAVASNRDVSTGFGMSVTWRIDPGTRALAPVEIEGSCP